MGRGRIKSGEFSIRFWFSVFFDMFSACHPPLPSPFSFPFTSLLPLFLSSPSLLSLPPLLHREGAIARTSCLRLAERGICQADKSGWGCVLGEKKYQFPRLKAMRASYDYGMTCCQELEAGREAGGHWAIGKGLEFGKAYVFMLLTRVSQSRDF